MHGLAGQCLKLDLHLSLIMNLDRTPLRVRKASFKRFHSIFSLFKSACGCVAASSKYPTAALSTMAFGSSRAFGPGCGEATIPNQSQYKKLSGLLPGRCFKLTLINTFLSSPPFYPTVTPPSIVVKVTDLCPGLSDWCKATEDKPNPCACPRPLAPWLTTAQCWTLC